MCGRLVITEPDLSVFVEPFEVQQVEAEGWRPRFNLAPTELAPLMTNEDERRLTLANFGLVPFWAARSRQKHKLINARVETIARSKAFSRALSERRGVIPVTGYFEWQRVDGRKQPHFIHSAEGDPLLLASVWEAIRGPEGQLVRSFAVITRPALGALQSLHSRMPLVLRARDLSEWLAPESRTSAQLSAVLNVEPEVDRLVEHQVSSLANSVRNDSPECIAVATDLKGNSTAVAQLALFDEASFSVADSPQPRGTR